MLERQEEASAWQCFLFSNKSNSSIFATTVEFRKVIAINLVMLTWLIGSNTNTLNAIQLIIIMVAITCYVNRMQKRNSSIIGRLENSMSFLIIKFTKKICLILLYSPSVFGLKFKASIIVLYIASIAMAQ